MNKNVATGVRFESLIENRLQGNRLTFAAETFAGHLRPCFFAYAAVAWQTVAGRLGRVMSSTASRGKGSDEKGM